MSSTYVGVRDGRPVLLKRCEDCDEEKVVTDDKSSGFYPLRREASDGTLRVTWGPLCKLCLCAKNSRRWYAMTSEERRADSAARWARVKADPERLAATRLIRLESARRRLEAMTDDEFARWAEKRSAAYKRWYRKKVKEDPTYFSRESRRIRSRRFQEQSRARQVVDISQERMDLEPLLRAIDDWLARDPDHDYTLLAARAGVSERGIGRLVNREHEYVTVEIADRIALAIGESFELLYPYEEAA